MDDFPKKALLPPGLSDSLPPDAEFEEYLARSLMDRFACYGYQRVRPPLIEFEDGLLDGAGVMLAERTFRLMDPVSHRMLGLRADITPQVARLVNSRMKTAPRPLRLSYCGDVLRVTGSQLSPEREFRQVGVELIGAAHASLGDAEVILLGSEALSDLGVKGLSVDVTMPQVARLVCDELEASEEQKARLLAALDRKDLAAVSEVGGEAAPVLADLLSASGPVESALERLESMNLPEQAGQLAKRLRDVLDMVKAEAPDLTVTVDPVESRGFEYHTGISFTLFAQGVRRELGCGGRYLTPSGEPATGFTLYLTSLMRAVEPPTPSKRVYVPFQIPPEIANKLRRQGWVVVKGLLPVDDDIDEAKRLACDHVWHDGAVHSFSAE